MAARYWRGGAGTWDTSNTTNWSTTDGGTGGASVPTSADDVYFTSLSGSGTVTISGSVNCKDLNGSGTSVTVAGTGSLHLYGSTFTPGSAIGGSFTGTVYLHASMALSGTWNCYCNVTTVGSVGFTGTGTLVASSDIKTIQLGTSAFNSLQLTAGTTLDTQGAISCSSLQFLTTTANPSRVCRITGGYSLTVTTTLTIGNFTDNRYATIVDGATISFSGAATVNAAALRNCSMGNSTNWSTKTRLSNLGGNTNITFPAAITCYWNSSTSNSFHEAKWFTTSGGSTSSRVPLAQDTATFDSASFTAAGLTATNSLVVLPNINIVSPANSPIFSFNVPGQIAGDIAMSGTFTLTASTSTDLNFSRAGPSFSFGTGGRTLAGGVNATGKTLTTTSTVVLAANTNFVCGTLNTAHNVTVGNAVVGTLNRTSGTFTVRTGSALTVTTGVDTTTGSDDIILTRDATLNLYGGDFCVKTAPSSAAAITLNVYGNIKFKRFVIDTTAATSTWTTGGSGTYTWTFSSTTSTVVNTFKITGRASLSVTTDQSWLEVYGWKLLNLVAASPNKMYDVGGTNLGGNTNWTFGAYVAFTNSTFNLRGVF